MSATQKYISPRQAAEFYGVSLRTIQRWLAEGKIQGYRLGGKLVRLEADEVQAALIGSR
ncbi:MAG: excisionase family DNA-binding protein [Mycobacterium sp.]|nr:excisionase family DNA-binding protein [Mycobacterium sp.]